MSKSVKGQYKEDYLHNEGKSEKIAQKTSLHV